MSTENQTAAGNAACPLCDDYRGQPSSVEAHISRMTDLVHQGEVGRAHRDDIQRQADEAQDDGDEPDADNSDSDRSGQWDVLPVPEDKDGDSEGVDGEESADDGTGTDSSDESDGVEASGGVPMPSTEALVIGAVVLGAFLYWRSRSSSSASSTPMGSSRQTEEDEQTLGRQTSGGLSG